MLPVDPITFREAAEILGCAPSTVSRQVLAGRVTRHGGRYEQRALSRAEVETLAAEILPSPRAHRPRGYWARGDQASEILGISRARVNQLAAADRLPFIVHRDGSRLYRRAQLEVMTRKI